jgi:hypothetical protein
MPPIRRHTVAQNIEAVILTGPRRGDIIQLPEQSVPELSDEELKLLNAGLDDVIAAIDRLSAEYRSSTQALKEKVTT